MLRIAYNIEESTEGYPQYFVYDSRANNAVVYHGSYVQCLVLIGADIANPEMSFDEINAKCEGLLTRR